jgi:hypothetical protein
VGRGQGARGFDLEKNGLLTPTLSSFGKEREKMWQRVDASLNFN